MLPYTPRLIYSLENIDHYINECSDEYQEKYLHSLKRVLVKDKERKTTNDTNDKPRNKK